MEPVWRSAGLIGILLLSRYLTRTVGILFSAEKVLNERSHVCIKIIKLKLIQENTILTLKWTLEILVKSLDEYRCLPETLDWFILSGTGIQ